MQQQTMEIYEVTTDGGLSFSTSGSKVRYANQLVQT